MKIVKAIAALPATLEPNTLYAVRIGTGFDVYFTDDTGAIAYRTNRYERVQIGGRWHGNTDNRWVGMSSNYGHGTENYNQNAGTGAEPAVRWQDLGPILKDGCFVEKIDIQGRTNNGELSAWDWRIFHQTGPWEGTWDSNGETTRTLLASVNGMAFDGNDMKRHTIDINQQVTDDGFLVMYGRPIGTLTAKRYLLCAMDLHLRLP